MSSAGKIVVSVPSRDGKNMKWDGDTSILENWENYVARVRIDYNEITGKRKYIICSFISGDIELTTTHTAIHDFYPRQEGHSVTTDWYRVRKSKGDKWWVALTEYDGRLRMYKDWDNITIDITVQFKLSPEVDLLS